MSGFQWTYCYLPIVVLGGILGLLPLTSHAQEPAIEESPSVQSVLNRYIAEQHANKEVLGWRILITSTRDRRDLERKRQQFKRHFPSIELQWEYRDPNYRLYAGAFRNRLEVRPMFNRIKKVFPQALEVKDQIPIEEFLDQYKQPGDNR